MSKARDLADKLIGTCESAVIHEEMDTDAEIAEFDELAFLCEQCDWWCSTDELNNDGPINLCDDCLNENSDDDD